MRRPKSNKKKKKKFRAHIYKEKQSERGRGAVSRGKKRIAAFIHTRRRTVVITRPRSIEQNSRRHLIRATAAKTRVGACGVARDTKGPSALVAGGCIGAPHLPGTAFDSSLCGEPRFPAPRPKTTREPALTGTCVRPCDIMYRRSCALSSRTCHLQRAVIFIAHGTGPSIAPSTCAALCERRGRGRGQS